LYYIFRAWELLASKCYTPIMAEASDAEDKIKIEILGESEKVYGSRVGEKQELLQPVMETVTPENWLQYFPNTPLTPDKKKGLEAGTLYLKVALDPQNRARAGSVEVYHQYNNTLSVEVSEGYQRRGVAGALIKQAQDDHDNLHLLNFAGKAGEGLYVKMGFKPEGGVDHFVWEKRTG
jgi:GNAT superfamily N-acetyltransferase